MRHIVSCSHVAFAVAEHPIFITSCQDIKQYVREREREITRCKEIFKALYLIPKLVLFVTSDLTEGSTSGSAIGRCQVSRSERAYRMMLV